MKREQLKEMGLDKERIDSIMKINGEDIEHAKEVALSLSLLLTQKMESVILKTNDEFGFKNSIEQK